MSKQVKVTANAKQREILSDALNSSENEQLDLYKAIFGGRGASCPVVAVSKLRSRISAYDRHDTFLKAAV
ncbi:MAG: hypothetical protein AAF990_19265 [Bacteroidota bacterium]